MHPHLLGLIGFNTATYALYKLSTGPKKNHMRKTFTVEQGSSSFGYLTGSFFETSFNSLLFNSFILSTVGSAHIAMFGITSFWTVFAAASVLGLVASS